ncbi:MAG: hypothetical protein AB8Y22_02305 [Coxiella-like endosymbiont]|nr:hypothetical protein [Coxiella-like endosymbiont]UVE59308.1 hypothetical protein LG660_02520 [Coxiella-like endosymbiont]
MSEESASTQQRLLKLYRLHHTLDPISIAVILDIDSCILNARIVPHC